MSETVAAQPSQEEKKLTETDESLEQNKPVDPPPKGSILKDLDPKDYMTTTDGPNLTIDVQPDFRNIVIMLVDHCEKIFSQIQQFRDPMLTPASLLAYFLELIYTFGTLTDTMNIRLYSSKYAEDFMASSQNEQVLNFISYGATPPIIEDIIKNLIFTFDPRRQNIAFMFSFANFSFQHDFGRVFPLHMFWALHNIIVQNSRQYNVDQIYIEWLNYTVISTTEINITVANIIGAGVGQDLYDNYLSIKLKKLISMISSQDTSRRRTLKLIPFSDPNPVANFNEVNPYKYLLYCEMGGHAVLSEFHTQMNETIKTLFNKHERLGTFFGIASGVNLLNHFYTRIGLPTHHTVKTQLTTTSNTINDTLYAQKIKFKTRTGFEFKDVIPSIPDGTDYNSSLYLRGPDDKNGIKIDPLQGQRYISSRDRHPRIIFYSPYGTGASSHYHTLVNGITIETDEIDGFHIPQPNIDESLYTDNSHFLQSAVPISKIFAAASLNGVHGTAIINNRADDTLDHTKVSLSLYNMAENRLPIFDNAVHSTVAVNRIIGFTNLNHVRTYRKGSSKISYEITENIKAFDERITHEVFAWSSYRWNPTTANNKSSCMDRTFMILNLRTVYGTYPEVFFGESVAALMK